MTTPRPRRTGRTKRARLMRWAGLAVLLGSQTAGAAAPSPPAGWTDYAREVSATLAQNLAAGDESAVRARAALASTGLAAVDVSIWINPEGGVTRIMLPDLADPTARANIIRVLRAPPALPRPPSALPFPMRLRLSVGAPGSPPPFAPRGVAAEAAS